MRSDRQRSLDRRIPEERCTELTGCDLSSLAVWAHRAGERPWRCPTGPERLPGALRGALLRVPSVRRMAARRGMEQPYRQLLAQGQVEPLDRDLLRVTAEYAADVLGDVAYAGELRLYTAVQGSFREGLIAGTYFGQRVMPNLSSREVRRLGFTRSLASSLLGREGSPDLGHRVGGRWLDADLVPTTRARVADAARSRGPDVVVKLNSTRRSQGVEVLAADLLREVEPNPGTDLTVQAFVTSHPDLARLSPGATPPVRILTVIDGSEPRFVAAHIRLGPGATRVAGGPESLTVPVLHEGRIADVAADRAWRLHARHPATGAEFAGVAVPSFAPAVERCLAWHRRFPQAGIVGWDVAIDAAGSVQLLEWNLYWPGITFHEALTGPNFVGLDWERFARMSPNA